ncbi:MAG: hypothetical protein QM760_02040 [Nibricoccus sp.]
MLQNPSTKIPRMEFFVCLLVLGAVLGFLIHDSLSRSRQIAAVSGIHGVSENALAIDEESPTGYLHQQRSIILPARSMDGYHWIMQTQTMLVHGGERIRHVDYDGAPDGRSVHWASPYRWWLGLLAWLEHDRNTPWGIAVERTAFSAGPVLLGLSLLIFTPLLAFRFAPAAGTLFAVGCVAVFPFYVDFVAGYVDHHGIASLCAMASVLLFLNRDGSFKSGCFAAITSGIAGATGIWISAATQIPVLIGLGLGAVVACWTERGEKSGAVWSAHPAIFRIWGISGAAMSLIAYLIEYLPGDFGLRLEVNHPLYALTWLAAGEALCRLARIWSRPTAQSPARDMLAGVSALVVAAVLPITILLSKDRTFLVSDSFLWRLHHDFIAEFQSLPGFLGRSGYAWTALSYCLPFLLIVPALWLGFSRKQTLSTRSSLKLAAVPSVLILALTWNQVRWWGLEYAMLIPVVAAIFRALRTDAANKHRSVALWTIGCGLLFVPGVIATSQESGAESDWNASDVRSLAEREVAHWLRQRAGDARVVVAASPTVTTSLVFHGGLTGVGTLYWENVSGLKNAAAFYAAPTAESARKIAKDCGITHIVVVSWDGFEGVYARLARGLAAEAPIPTDAFIAQLLTAPAPPPWLRAIDFKLPQNPALDGQQIRIYEVTSEAPPLRALINAAEYSLATGEAENVNRLRGTLEQHLSEFPARIMTAYIAARQNNPAAFSRALAQLSSSPAQIEALSLEDALRLTAVLAAAERFDDAGLALKTALSKTTKDSLRQLPPDKLVELITLSESAGMNWPDPALRVFADKLLPSSLRSQLKN